MVVVSAGILHCMQMIQFWITNSLKIWNALMHMKFYKIFNICCLNMKIWAYSSHTYTENLWIWAPHCPHPTINIRLKRIIAFQIKLQIWKLTWFVNTELLNPVTWNYGVGRKQSSPTVPVSLSHTYPDSGFVKCFPDFSRYAPHLNNSHECHPHKFTTLT